MKYWIVLVCTSVPNEVATLCLCSMYKYANECITRWKSTLKVLEFDFGKGIRTLIIILISFNWCPGGNSQATQQ